MKKQRKTYGVYGAIEWHANLKVGHASLRMSFTGGALTSQGIIPASYTTDDPVKQRVIESSEAYRSGRIKTVRCIDLNEEIEYGSNVKAPEQIDESQSEAVKTPELTEVKVSCADDAREYMREHHGIATSKTRTEEALSRAAEQCGVVFVYPKS